jgi:hypothetical protein
LKKLFNYEKMKERLEKAWKKTLKENEREKAFQLLSSKL